MTETVRIGNDTALRQRLMSESNGKLDPRLRYEQIVSVRRLP